MRRGRMLNCTLCKAKGATIGCLIESCKNSYHFPCAEQTGWPFSTAAMRFHCPRCCKRENIRPEHDGGAGDDSEVAAKYGLEKGDVWTGKDGPADRTWLTADNPVDATMRGFCPQVTYRLLSLTSCFYIGNTLCGDFSCNTAPLELIVQLVFLLVPKLCFTVGILVYFFPCFIIITVVD